MLGSRRELVLGYLALPTSLSLPESTGFATVLLREFNMGVLNDSLRRDLLRRDFWTEQAHRNTL